MLERNDILQERYRIIRQLGHGGMGAVYEAKDERLGSTVAVKEIIIEIEKIPTKKQRTHLRRAFEREAKLLANHQHEVFPRVIDYFSENDRQFLIMELVYGDDLSELLKINKKPFALKKTLEWTEHLLDALDYLHTQTPPIFHRDIKPQNLKVTSRGKIKLLDFGIAKSIDQNASTFTNQTFVGATLNYSPIEQILPAISDTFREFIILKHEKKAKAVLKQATNARCDLYSLGATVYHLLTNRAPIDSAKRSLEIWEGNQDPLINPLELNPHIPQTISAWLLKAMQIEHTDRFDSANEMREVLHRAIGENKAEKRTLRKAFAANGESSSKITLNEDSEDISNALTESIIESAKSPFVTKKELNLVQNPLETQPAFEEVTPNQFESELTIERKLPFDDFETKERFAQTKEENELTGAVYFDERLIEDEEKPATLPIAPIKISKTKPQSDFSIYSVLAVLAVFFIITVAVGGVFWLYNVSQTRNSVSTANTESAIPTPDFSPTPMPTLSPTPMPSVSATISPTVSPTPEPTPQPTVNKPVVSEPKPKTAFVEKIPPTPVTKTSKTPAAQKNQKIKTNTPQDPNCVFTNSCQ
jgi:serine/threonine protein kinase